MSANGQDRIFTATYFHTKQVAPRVAYQGYNRCEPTALSGCQLRNNLTLDRTKHFLLWRRWATAGGKIVSSAPLRRDRAYFVRGRPSQPGGIDGDLPRVQR